jgi:hypothetical protein
MTSLVVLLLLCTASAVADTRCETAAVLTECRTDNTRWLVHVAIPSSSSSSSSSCNDEALLPPPVLNLPCAAACPAGAHLPPGAAACEPCPPASFSSHGGGVRLNASSPSILLSSSASASASSGSSASAGLWTWIVSSTFDGRKPRACPTWTLDTAAPSAIRSPALADSGCQAFLQLARIALAGPGEIRTTYTLSYAAVAADGLPIMPTDPGAAPDGIQHESAPAVLRVTPRSCSAGQSANPTEYVLPRTAAGAPAVYGISLPAGDYDVAWITRWPRHVPDDPQPLMSIVSVDVEGTTFNRACFPCPPGTVPSLNRTECTPCSPGTFNADFGASTCEPCPNGSFRYVL